MPEDQVVTTELVKQGFVELVAERGREYTHTDECVYFDREGQPSCAIGWIMNRKLGLTAEHLDEIVDPPLGPNSTTIGSLVTDLENIPGLPLHFESEAAFLMDNIQTDQDRGLNYGLILDRLGLA